MKTAVNEILNVGKIMKIKHYEGHLDDSLVMERVTPIPVQNVGTLLLFKWRGLG